MYTIAEKKKYLAMYHAGFSITYLAQKAGVCRRAMQDNIARWKREESKWN